MPTLPAVPKVLRVDMGFSSGANASIRDRIFFSYTGSVSVADLTTFLTHLGTVWGTNMAPLQSSGQSLILLEGTDLNSSSGAQVPLSVSVVGGAAGVQLAEGSAAVIKFKIARRYRGGHPRFYFSGIVQAELTNPETWSSTFQSNLTSDWAAFIAAAVTSPPAAMGTMAHVNVSYFSGFTNLTTPSGRQTSKPALRVGGPIVDPVIGYSVNPHVASQRRRNLQ